MEPERHCVQCGQAIPPDEADCPRCSKPQGFLWWMRRETFLLLMFVVLIAFFVVTGFAAKYYHAEQRAMAEEWYARGEADLRMNEPRRALEDFRNALAYSKEDSLYRLRLAQALVAAGRTQEARTYLLSLWDRQPGNGTVNLELARLAAKEHNVAEATRYYHNAIYGVWNNDPSEKRRMVRLELAEFLLGVGADSEAGSELIALAADLPPDPQLQAKVGNLLMKVKEYEQALKLFRDALSENPDAVAALVGAGEASYEMRRYPQAQGHLERAVRRDPKLTRAADLLATTNAVLTLDPFARRLTSRERARRASLAFTQATKRLEACAAQRNIPLQEGVAQEPLQTLYQHALETKPKANERSLRRDPDLVSNVMDLVFEIERTTAQECGEPHGLDHALLLIARTQQEGNRP